MHSLTARAAVQAPALVLLAAGRRRRERTVRLVRSLPRRGRNGLLDAAELGTIRHEQGLPTLCDEERAGAIGGDYAEAAERVGDQPDEGAGATSGIHALARR